MGYAEIAHAHSAAQDRFECKLLLDLDPAPEDLSDWDDTSTDSYDNSLEFHGVPDQHRLSEAQQKFIHDEGFHQCWLNHKDGWETHYVFRDDGFACYRTDRAKERAVPTKIVPSTE